MHSSLVSCFGYPFGSFGCYPGPIASATGKAWHAAIAMRGDAFIDIITPFDRIAQGVRQFARRRQPRIETRPHDPLSAARCQWTRCGNAFGELTSCLAQTIGRINALHQTQTFHLTCIDYTPGANQLRSEEHTSELQSLTNI